MTDTDIRPLPTLADVERLTEDSDAIADGSYCMGCGDEFEVNDRVVMTPFDRSNPSNRMLVLQHLHCAVRNDDIALTGTLPADCATRFPLP